MSPETQQPPQQVNPAGSPQQNPQPTPLAPPTATKQSTAPLIVSIIALCTSWLPFVGLVMSFVAIVLRTIKKVTSKVPLTIAVIAFLVGLVSTVGFFVLDDDTDTTPGSSDSSTGSVVEKDFSCFSVELPPGFIAQPGSEGVCGGRYEKEADGNLISASFAVLSGSYSSIRTSGNVITETVQVSGKSVNRTIQDLRTSSESRTTSDYKITNRVRYELIDLDVPAEGQYDKLELEFRLATISYEYPTDQEVAAFIETVDTIVASLTLK